MLLRPAVIVITAALSTLFVASCANQDNGKTKPDTTAFEWAMDQDIRFNTLINECGKLEAGLANSGAKLRAQWQKQYWGAINAANDAYNNQQAAKIYTYNGEKISLPAARFMVEHKESAMRELSYQKRLPAKQVEFCQVRMAAYENKEDGLGAPANSNKLRYLNELASKAPKIPPRSVPSLAGSLQPASPGPALYEMERDAVSKSCSNPQILTLFNANHNELYGTYCKGSAGYFTSCEWSQCSPLK